MDTIGGTTTLCLKYGGTCKLKVTGYSLYINIHEKYITFLFFVQDPGMHALNFTAKKVGLACNSCAGWVGGAGNLIAVPAVYSRRTKY